jgi:dimethylhistidine N-methyltransferase
MTHVHSGVTSLIDSSPRDTDLVQEIIQGLSQPQKMLPSKLFYDAQGSKLFDRITELEEYYPTRTEMGIMERYLGEIVNSLGSGCQLVEYGSGSSLKTRILLDHARDLAGYVPIDISREHLAGTAADLSATYPHIPIHPVYADYTDEVVPPVPATKASRTVVFFPGSTIGNFTPDRARTFLEQIRHLCGDNGGLLIGVDLQKDPSVLERAYNDADGVTAEFNLNILRRINREMRGTFDLARFRHKAFYNPEEGRIEMHLVSIEDQRVRVADAVVSFQRDETIRTEYSYKYTLPAFATLAEEAGFQVRRVWTDPHQYFSVQYLEPAL